MKVLVMLHEEDPDAWLTASDEYRDAAFARHHAFEAAVAERGAVLAGAALDAVGTGRTLRPGPDDDRAVTEGPFAETTEQVTGVYLLEVDSVETALELARLLPTGYAVEVRPSIPVEGF